MPDMLVSVSNALETLMIPMVNSDYRPFEDQLIQHMDNVFDPMICLSLVAPPATSWPLRVCSVELIVYSESKTVIVCLISMFLAMLLLMGTLYVHLLLFTLLHIEHIAAQLPAEGVAH
ncbi:hypothetical protein MJT46_011415 [Ovis ammon polii x Ovis aries]|nr:hypothetical protein MJT46_011415 [Ovis ammon polii x Ovis aries]